MKNSLSDLNNHLFAQLERLSDENLAGDNLKEEIARAKTVTSVSREIILNARLVLDAQEIMGNVKPEDKPDVLRVEKK